MTAPPPQSPTDRDRCAGTVSPCPAATALEVEWRALEAQSAGSVFLSWPWIGATAIIAAPNSLVVRIRRGDRIVGLGLIGMRKRRFPWLRRPDLHLNETGEPAEDRIMTEYNGLLTWKGEEKEVAEAFLATIGGDKDLGSHDLRLSGVSDLWGDLCLRRGLATRLSRPPQVAPYATLDAQAANDPLATMTRNSRQQINRSLRYYERRGPLALERATDAEQALEWLDALEAPHTRSWRLRGKAGAFSTPAFKNFHRRLISTAFAEGVPDILRVRAGETILGYLYNLRWRGEAYSYQSGFHFEDDPQARPGLVAHVMAMRLYRAEGFSTYRFLAGDARYKTSLATDSDELLWMTAHPPSKARWLAVAVERLLGALLPEG